MSNIQDYLTQILSAVYGKDVRQSIHDAIKQCYDDGKAGSVDLVAREQISQLSSDIRRCKCKFDFCNNLDQTLSKEYDQVYEYSTVANKIEIANYYKMRGVWIAVEIKPSREQCESYSNGEISGEDLELNVLPNADYVGNMVNDVIASGLEVIGIKFHNNWIYDNWATLKEYRESIFAKYETAINDVMSRVAGNTERVTVLNESKNMLTDSDNASYIKNMLANIKAKGYKVGFCGIDYFATDLFDCVDILSLHWYPYISNKNEKTTIEDCKLAWEIYLGEKGKAMYDFHFDYPTKEVWIVETGVQNYWEALRAPETYISDGTASENNVVQYMFFDALFEAIKDCEFIEGVCAWYFSNAKYNLMVSLMKEYFGKEIE